MDNVLAQHIDVICNDLYDDDDGVIVLFGDERAGKSILESQIVKRAISKLKCDFSIERDIHYDGQQYINNSFKKKQRTINCLDESRRTLNKLRMMSNTNQQFMDFLSECGSQNQLHLILLPNYYDLDKDVATRRLKLLIKVIKTRDPVTKKIKRGIFQIIRTTNKDALKQLYKYKSENIPKSMIAYEGKFTPEWGWNEEEYRNKKEREKAKYYTEQEEKIKFTNKDYFVVNAMINYITANRMINTVFLGDVSSIRGFERLRYKFKKLDNNNNTE